MKTVLGSNGEIGIPREIREADHLRSGDSFDVERVMPGQYVVTKTPPPQAPLTVAIGADGLPLIRTGNGVITSQRVKDLEGLTP